MTFYDSATQTFTFDNKTDGGQPVEKVRADLFTPSGKWKYQVWLDYSDLWPRLLTGVERAAYVEQHPDANLPENEYLDPGEAAWLALTKATRAGTSDVSVVDNREGYWTLVVTDPPNGWPILTSRNYSAHPVVS